MSWKKPDREELLRAIDRYLAAAPVDEGSELSPERVLQGREHLAQFIAALRDLPERTRDIFMLRCFEGLKHAEIARLYGLSTRAVEKHCARALAELSAAVEEGRTP